MSTFIFSSGEQDFRITLASEHHELFYANNSWCSDARVILKYCSPDAEKTVVKRRPFCLPCELTAIIIIAAYVSPSADVKKAMGELYNTVSQSQTSYPDAIYIIAGDFNKPNLKSVLPNFHQHVTCATRGENTLDHLYTNITKAYTFTLAALAN